MWIVGSNQKGIRRGVFVNINALTEIVVSVGKAALGHHFQLEFVVSSPLPHRAEPHRVTSPVLPPLLGQVQVSPSPSFTLKEPPNPRWWKTFIGQ